MIGNWHKHLEGIILQNSDWIEKGGYYKQPSSMYPDMKYFVCYKANSLMRVFSSWIFINSTQSLATL